MQPSTHILYGDPSYLLCVLGSYANGTGVYASAFVGLNFIDLQTFIDKPTVNALLHNAVQEAASTHPSPLIKAGLDTQQAWVKSG